MDQPPLMVSISGLRGLVGQSLTPAVAMRFAGAFGQWLKGQSHRAAHAPHAPHVVLGRDSRPSGQMYEMAAAAGLAAVGCRVTTLGIVSTPCVAVMLEHLGADGGMVVTASHNPIIWNGLKPLSSAGVAPPAGQARQIIQRFHEDDFEYADVTGLVPMNHDDTAMDIHVKRVLEHIDIERIRKRKLKVVLDSVHGAGGPEGRALLDALGVELVHLYAQPTGRFPHTPEPTRDNLIGLCEAVKEHGADIGFAQDPDADRLAIVDEGGTYIGEEYTLALATLHVLATADQGAVVAANLSTSRMVDDIAERFAGRVVRTAVGEANVADAMREHEAVIGGEGNGGVIWPAVANVRDSLVGMALVLELLATRKEALSKVVRSIPSYAIIKEKLPIRPGMAEQAIADLRVRFSDQKLDDQDGLRIDWPDRWLHVRASNTEPILRLIAEATDEQAAQALVHEAREVVTGISAAS